MGLTKRDIIEKVRDHLDRGPKEYRYRKYHIYDPTREYGLTGKKCRDCVEALIELIKQNLAKGEDILISGFGKFQVKEKNERRGRNPATNEIMTLNPRKVVTFRSSGKLKGKIRCFRNKEKNKKIRYKQR